MISIEDRKELTSLQQKKYRYKYNKFLVEGVRILEEALTMNKLEKLYYTKDLSSSRRKIQLINDATSKDVPIKVMTDKELKGIANTVSSQGVVGIVIMSEDHRKKIENNCIYLDEIRDPGNVGTIIRTADWFGIHNIVLSQSCVDPYNPKVIRSGMGAHFRLIIRKDYSLDKIKSSGFTILAADTIGKSIQSYHPAKSINWCLVMGSEADGISQKNRALVDNYISIPGSGNGDSLNVGVATGVFLNHLTN